MKKKILAIFGNVALYGQERSNIHVLNTLQENNYNLLLLVNDRGFHWHLQPEIEAHGLKYKKIRYPWNYRKTKSIKSLWLYLHDTISYNYQFYKAYVKFKPDYIHIANDFYYMTLSPVLCLIHCPIIFRLGDKPTTRYFYEKWLWKYFIAKRTTQFVCISKFIAKELQKVHPKLKNSSIIYNVPTSRKANTKENLPEINNQLFTVLYVGQISKIKGVHLLFDAAVSILERHKNLRFIFAGPLFQSELYFEIEKTAAYKKNRSSIFFVDKIQNINHLYKISDILIVPSIVEEALSNVVGEAKLAGCPSIVFKSGGLSELVTHKVDGFICDDKTTKGISSAIIYYLENPTILEQHKIAALNSINQLGLTQQRFTEKWISVYQQAQ